MKGWKSKTSDCTAYAQLPSEAIRYVEYIEKQLGVRIEWIGVGPGRDRMITRQIVRLSFEESLALSVFACGFVEEKCRVRRCV